MRYPKIPGALIGTWEIEVKAPLGEVWDYVSNTDRLNKAIGSGSVEYEEKPDDKGGSILFGKISNAGIISEYREYPYEWVEGQFVSVYRDYIRGPIKSMSFQMDYTPTEQGFVVHFTMQFELRTFLARPLVWLELQKKAIPRFRAAFAHVQRYLERKESKPLPVFGFKPNSKNESKYQEIVNIFSKVDSTINLKSKIISFILDSPDVDLLKIKPYQVARNIQEPRKKVLEFFLRSTKEGLFDMNWDILCPSCRGAKASSKHLYELKDKVHCPSCNIDYGPDFDKSVELTFTPNPKLRTVYGGLHCFGGPGTTPHLRAQIRIPSGQKETIKYKFQPGTYRIFSLQTQSELKIEVDPRYEKLNSFQYPESNLLKFSPGEVSIELSNPYNHEILVKLEKANWLEDTVTAFEVTTMQEFRDIFSSEVLKPGQEIGIRSISVLFTDLKGSTKFYNEKGDAFAYKVVSEHFEILMENAYKYEGAIVKTIGDAVMAVFPVPINALRYAIESHKGIKSLNEKYGEPLIQLRIGIHHGPALAVTMNEKLDYFGTTINLASRTEGQAESGEVAMTMDFFTLDGIESELKKNNLSYSSFEASLKGFDESYKMMRFTP